MQCVAYCAPAGPLRISLLLPWPSRAVKGSAGLVVCVLIIPSGGFTHRFTRFRGQQPGKLVGVRVQLIRDGDQLASSFCVSCCRPTCQSCSGAGDGLVDILLRGFRGGPQLFTSSGVDAVARLGGRALLVGDNLQRRLVLTALVCEGRVCLRCGTR